MVKVLTIPDRWSASDIPDLTGKRFLITGATSGIGLAAATELKIASCPMEGFFPRKVAKILNIDTIKFEETIPIFQDLNDVFFVFYEKGNVTHEINKLTSDFTSYPIKNHSITKRVFLMNKKNHRKTQRK